MIKTVKGIPFSHISDKIANNNKEYDVFFVNTDSNSDSYNLKIFLRKYNQDGQIKQKIKLILISGILAYPAFESIWDFNSNEYDISSKIYFQLCDEIDNIKREFDKSMMPVSTLTATIREKIRFIGDNHREKSNILNIDESSKEPGVSDWRESIYSGRYPNMSKEEKQRIKTFDGSQVDAPLKRKDYKTRQKY